jgi:hypothetical protein
VIHVLSQILYIFNTDNPKNRGGGEVEIDWISVRAYLASVINQRRRPPSVISNFAKTCPSPPLLSVSLEFSPHRTVRHMPRHVFVYVVLYGTLLGRNRDLKRLTSGELLGFLIGAATRKVQNKSVGT